MALLGAMLATSVSAGQAQGVWASQPDEAGAGIYVEIANCSNTALLCGTIVALYGPASDDPDNLVGREMIVDMAPDGPSEWSGGTIWAPDEDKTYDAVMELTSPDILSVSGCILGGLFCRGQDWTRVP